MQLIRYDLSKLRGLDNTSNPSYLGDDWLSSSINMIHTANYPCTLRSGILRMLYTSPSSNQQIMGMYEHNYFDGTRVNLLHMFDDLYSFDPNNPQNATTLIRSNIFATNYLTAYSSWLNNYIITDQRHHNYIGNHDGVFPLQIDAPTVTFTATASAGSGLTAGSYYYSYSRYSTSTGEYSPPSDPVSVTVSGGNLRVTLNSQTISTVEQFDMIQLYRTAVGADQMFELAKIIPSQFDSGYIDSTPDSDLVTISPVHDIDSTASITDKPEPAFDCEVHKSRLWLANFPSQPNKVRWSQLNATQFESTTDAFIELPDDGDEVVRIISQTAAMVVFKRNSIWVINGDVDQNNFTLQVMSPRENGVGAYAPWTAVQTPVGIIFLSSCGVWKYTNGSNIQDIGIPIKSTLDSLNMDNRDKFVGGYDPCLKAYYLSASTLDAGTDDPSNNITLVYFIETGAWSVWDFGNYTLPEGSGFQPFYPSVYAQFTISGRIRLLMGAEGYPYLLNSGIYVDGLDSGTISGSAYADNAITYDGVVQSNSSCTHYYKMNESSGTVMADSEDSANGSYGSLMTLNYSSGPWNMGSRNSVRTASGGSGGPGDVDRYISVGSFNWSTTFSVAFWVKTTSDSARLLFAADTGSQAGFFLYNNTTSGVTIRFLGGGAPFFTDVATNKRVDDGNWHHIVFTTSTWTSYNIYIDGVSYVGGATPRTANGFNGVAYMGSDPSTFLPTPDIQYSSLAYFNSVLSSDYVTELYNSATQEVLYDPSANFFTSGDGLDNIPVLVSHTGTGTVPVRTSVRDISSNYSQFLILNPAGTDVGDSDIYYIGAYLGNIETGRFTCGSTLKKRFNRISLEYVVQNHSIPIEVTYAIDYKTGAIQKFFIQDKGTLMMDIPSGDGVGIRLMIRSIGNNHPFTIIAVEIEYDTLSGTRTPGGASR